MTNFHDMLPQAAKRQIIETPPSHFAPGWTLNKSNKFVVSRTFNVFISFITPSVKSALLVLVVYIDIGGLQDIPVDHYAPFKNRGLAKGDLLRIPQMGEVKEILQKVRYWS